MSDRREESVLVMQLLLINELKEAWHADTRELARIFTKYEVMQYIDTCTELFNSYGPRGNIDDIEEYIFILGGCIYFNLREQQIRRRFPNQWIGLTNVKYNNSGEITSANVVYTDYNKNRQNRQKIIIEEYKDNLEHPERIAREVIPWYSGEPTLLDNIDVWEIEEKELHKFIGQVVDTRQLSKIYDIYMVLSNMENINFENETGEIVSFTEGILVSYSKTERGLGKESKRKQIIFNSKQEARLQEHIGLEIQAIDSFQALYQLTNEQLLDFMDEHNIWESFDNMEDINDLRGFTNEDLLRFFDSNISEEKIEQLNKEWYAKEITPSPDGEPIESLYYQSAECIKYLITEHKITKAAAFKKWFHSKMKKFIEDNQLYHITPGRCLWEYLDELNGFKDEFLFQDLKAEMQEKTALPKKKVVSIWSW